MTGLNVVTLKTLRPEEIAELAAASGPCITVLLPPYRPAAQSKSMAAILKTYCQEAARQLKARGISESESSELMEPLQRLSEAPEFARGSHLGRAIFRSRETFSCIDGIDLSPGVTVGGCFQLRPVLPDLHVAGQFFLLKLSQKEVALNRCRRFTIEAVDLPRGVPRTLDEALEFKPPDHDLENRSTSGSSTGSMRAVRFGTGSGRETERTYVADFFKAVDSGILELTHGAAPLILAGVDEDVAIFRAASRYPNLLKESIRGGAKSPLSEEDLLSQAFSILRSDSVERAAANLYEMKERVAPARFSTDLDAILRAAVEGRVGWIYINQDARMIGTFDGVRRGGRVNWGEEDLLNLAAVEVILKRGLAFALPSAKMPDGAAVAAAFRY